MSSFHDKEFLKDFKESDNCRNLNDTYYNTTLSQEALKYNTRVAFKNGNCGAYQCAVKRKCLDEICKHMKVPKTKWSKEMFQREALKFSSKSEFARISATAYRNASKLGILNEICAHMIKDRNDNNSTSNIDNIIIETMSKQLTDKNFKKSIEKLLYYKSNTKWTKELLYNTAITCFSRSEFAQRFPTAYRVACKRGVLEAVWRISHDNEGESPRKWYKDYELEEEAKKFEFVEDFAECNPKAYRAARRRGNLIYELYPQWLTRPKEK